MLHYGKRVGSWATLARLTNHKRSKLLFKAYKHKGLRWERHEGVAMKGFPGKFTLWAVAG